MAGQLRHDRLEGPGRPFTAREEGETGMAKIKIKVRKLDKLETTFQRGLNTG
jgi:hypothetical protein